MRDEVELLINDPYAGGLRSLRGGDGGRLAVDLDRAFIRLVGAAENLDERAFACTVFSEQREDFPGMEREINPLKCLDAGERFSDAAHPQQGGFGCRVGRGHGVATSARDPHRQRPCRRSWLG